MAAGARIKLADKLALFSDHWAPHLVETVDDYEVKLVKVQGNFVWHRHVEADELFLVLSGRLRMDFRDRQVEIGAGEIIVVPRGVEHKPFAADECQILLLERCGTMNTGDASATERTRAAVSI
ncbi:MAG: cupin domain-containing protein [Pseudomonadota bacterium]|nr:cupin domain-containing protein [Pseudomonadota bacterium]